MKSLLLLPLILFANWSLAQETSGKIIDAATTLPLAYVNIGVVGESRGTVSGENGRFQLRLPAQLAEETLKLSILGYESQSFTVKEFRQKMAKNGTIKMRQIGVDLREVIVVPRFNKTKRIGNKAVAKKLTDGFDGDELGREGGIIIKLKERYRPGVITSFRAYVSRNPYKEIKFRLNFYTLKNGLPDKPLPQESIIITSTIKEGVLEADLEPYDIIVKDDFAITLEWIEDFDKDGNQGWGGLRFAMRRFGPKCVYRYASQDNWEAYSGLLAPSPCMNVTVGYK